MSAAYDSAQDSGDDLFDDRVHHDTVATLPLGAAEHQQQSTFVTQPTQPLHTPVKTKNLLTKHQSSSPSVQVSASSPTPARTPSTPAPRPAPLDKGALNDGILANSMAPPGTQFRPPGYNIESQYVQTQTQQADTSDDERRLESSSDNNDQSADIKPSTFIRGERSLNGEPNRIAESPQSQRPFKAFASQFAYQRPQKRPAANDMASAYATGGRRTKVPRQTGPAKAEAPQEDMKLSDIMDWSMQQKVTAMTSVLPDVSITTCYRALTLKRGEYQDALDYVIGEGEKAQKEAKRKAERPSAGTIDLVSEGDEEPLPGAKAKTAKRDVGKSASIAQKWSSTQAPTTKQQPTAPSRSITEKYASTQQSPIIPLESDEKPKKPGRILGKRQGQVDPLQSSPASSPSKTPAKAPPQQRRRHVIDEDDEEDDADAQLTDEDSGVGVEDQAAPAIESRLLDFINSRSSAALVDLSGSPQEVIDQVLDHRPFSNLDKVRKVTVEVTTTTKKGKSRKTIRKIGERLVDACLDMLTGYEAVDELVQECERLGKPMAKDMKQWGLNAFGASKSTGELDMVDLESAHDSGIGTPASTPSQAGDSPNKSKKRKLLKQPKTLSSDVTMMDHQIAGLNWLSLLYTYGLSGILADDMGLGKTLQVIAYLTHLYEAQISAGPHLIIVPGSTIENWLREFRNFSPGLQVEPYYGGMNERPIRQEQISKELAHIHVIVTTYDMAMKPDDLKFLRKEIKPVVCVWDEAHELKNSQSKKYKNLIRISARQRLMLTGTPLQNNLTEMASLLAFLMPHVFAAQEEELQVIFKSKTKLDASAGAGNRDTSSKDSAALLSTERISRARSMITPFILRRKKHQVLKDLPKKTSSVEYCPLEGDQAALYHEIESNYREILARRRAKQALSTKPTNKDDSTQQPKSAAEVEKEKDDAATSILTSLRKAAIHPLLFRRHYADATLHKIVNTFLKSAPRNHDYNAQFVFEDLSVFTDFELHRWLTDPDRHSSLRKFALKGTPWLDASAKARTLITLLKRHQAEGRKTLVFSQFTMVMDILEEALSTADLAFFRLDGSTKMEQRQDMIDAFHAAPVDGPGACSVFMLSTGAGGQGINLACADRVVIFDSGFNPHADVQAENRAHRVGQTKEVVVTRLVSRGTVEEQILRVGEVKVRLDEEVAGGGGAGSGGEKEGETVGKGMVERLLGEKLEEGEKVKTEDEQKPDKAGGKDLAEAFREGLKGAGLDVKT